MQLFTLTASLHCKNLGHLFFPTLFQFGGETDVTNQTTASGNTCAVAQSVHWYSAHANKLILFSFRYTARRYDISVGFLK